METPVLSKKQQKKALSGKKAPLKNLRCVLVQPYKKYWPLINDDDELRINELLSKLLPAAKRPNVNMQFQDVNTSPKEKLQVETESVYPSSGVHIPLNEIFKSINIGINAVSRSMENKTATCVLLSGKVDPPLMTNHICSLAAQSHIPLLVLNNLSTTFKNILGYSSITISFKCNNTTDHLWTLCQLIKEISLKFPFPDYNKSKRNETSSSNIKCKHQDEDKQVIQEVVTPKDLYLIRLSKKYRVFVPNNETIQAVANTSNDWTDFVALDNTTMAQPTLVKKSIPMLKQTDQDIPRFSVDVNMSSDNDQPIRHKKEKVWKKGLKVYRKDNDSNSDDISYVALKVKKMQGNSNRPSKI